MHQLNAMPGESKCAWWCVQRETCCLGCVLPTVGSLCKQKDPECDKETSECTDFDGVALCQCKSGYFKYNKMDHSCRGIALYAAFLFWLELCLTFFFLFPPVKKVVHVCVCPMCVQEA